MLAFAALLFGAANAVGVEIDREAVTTSIRNADENGLGKPKPNLKPNPNPNQAQLCDPQQRRLAAPTFTAAALTATPVASATVAASTISARLAEATGPTLATPAGCRGTCDDDGRGVGGRGAGGGGGARSSSSGGGGGGASVGGSDGGRLFTPPSASAEMQRPRGDAIGAEAHRPAPPAASAASAASAAPPRRVSPLAAAPATAPAAVPAAVPGERRVGVGGLVLHVDVDSFFAQCHQVEQPLKWPR